jgi:deoxyribonuclease-4
MLIGHNISTDITDKSLQKALDNESNYVQIFTSDPCSFKYNDYFNDTIIKKYNNKLQYVIHGSFLINLCRLPNDNITRNSINLLKKDLKISNSIGALGVIIHMGKDTGKLGSEKSFNMYVDNLNRVLSETKKGTIILETGAGCGNEIATRLNELARLREFSIDKSRVKFCIDTCHIFSAGYDLTNDTIVESLEGYIENTLGWNNVVIAHVNDSKENFCSKKDRHADIPDGLISRENLNSFMMFLHNFKKRNIPMILETPSDSIEYKSQIELIKIYMEAL